MKLQGWIIYNGSLPGTKFLDFAEWIQAAAARKYSQTTIYKNNELLSFLSTDLLKLLKEDMNSLPDYVVFADKDIYLANQLESLGVRVFNRAEVIQNSDDKIASYQQLARQNLPIPKTIVAPKVFTNVQVDTDSVNLAIDQLGFPMIIKEAFGSFGEQVYLIHTKEELVTCVQALQGKAFMFQEFVSSSYGKDIRLHVVGDQVVAGMKRQAANDFRANVSSGATMEAYDPTDEERKLAISAAKALGADFAGVDLLFGPNNRPIICEINSNAHIRNMYDCTGINVADFIIDYILDTINKN
ncbi:ribosomal protein S6--L-glutamate ligase/gamma-F420-2:alpha-L-glutamate ligase [Virgibacillus natechei]|uniref:Ribosomal protein S6--L-glutamate ligase/gamma-F420-2:alpha-L-glutamate ligase n=1 Tax=Virgibacillus natechei TaxID=1216297 RepID=A0ABS4ID33_9BACI|nr:RimK family alpha-L-glutamate ligase [Virgibacillus natechei]MBP1968805.1 ribosomal protein S6--L-glutamate ligase/gamma-F420-2:alpha-L-glutamate ligase [Virgibacillus natechei]UZD11603.1 RimK family alpha-L-glutamate ligase [Virgibacillus natechei]